MTIVEKIIHTINDATGLPVYYHDEPTLNVITSKMEFPCALFYLLSQGRTVQEGGQIKERVTAAVFFVNLSEFDFDAVKNEQVIDVCKGYAFRWLSSFSASPLLTLENNNGTERVYDKFDDILTGFGLSVDLKESEGYCPVDSTPCQSDFNNDFSEDFLFCGQYGDDDDFINDFNNDFNNDFLFYGEYNNDGDFLDDFNNDFDNNNLNL